MNILITGAKGFIGRNLVAELNNSSTLINRILISKKFCYD